MRSGCYVCLAWDKVSEVQRGEEGPGRGHLCNGPQAGMTLPNLESKAEFSGTHQV